MRFTDIRRHFEHFRRCANRLTSYVGAVRRYKWFQRAGFFLVVHEEYRQVHAPMRLMRPNPAQPIAFLASFFRCRA